MIRQSKMRQVGLVGWPAKHSLSPAIFGYWFHRYGIDASYEVIAVEPELLECRIRELRRTGFTGLNVTIPHKENAFRFVDKKSKTAERVGSVNIISFRPDGRVHGDSSDGFGFIESLRNQVPDWNAKAGPATLLGAGGAARAIADALVQAGAPEVRIVNRTLSRAELLVRDIPGPLMAVPFQESPRAIFGAALVVNATSLGMTGQPPLKISLDGALAGATVTDIVYTPLDTPLLAEARRSGRPTADGLGMLLHQARPAFEAWFGKKPEVDENLREAILRQKTV